MEKTVFERRPVLTLSVFIFSVLVIFGILAEIVLRFTLSYNIGYYTAASEKGVYHYPYGEMPINNDGFPDAEFDLSSAKPRIGYFGDSVIMGVGAGYGYRISDILERQYPSYEHWTFGMMGNGLLEKSLMDYVDQYKLKKVVYAMNLNDILPPLSEETGSVQGGNGAEKTVRNAALFVREHMDWLRGKSYLYTAIRTKIKNILQIYGYDYNGLKAIELYPKENEDTVRGVALRLNEIASALKQKGVGFCVILLPYEIQISQPAAKTYRALGIEWEDGFDKGSTQEILKKYLKISNVYDGMKAFKGKDQSETGEYFVYNKGDKIDFNHPNREGHALLAQGVISSNACGF